MRCEEQRAADHKKDNKDETSKSFMPEDHEVELLKFMKQQEVMIAESQKTAPMEEVKDDGDEAQMTL